MARTAEFIKDYIKSRIAANALISTLATNPDFDNSLIGQFVQAIAEEIAEHDIIADNHVAAIEEQIEITNPHTATWVQQKALEFQYDENNPQILEPVDGSVNYPEIDEALRIITVAAVATSAGRLANCYVAKNDPPEKLSALELASIETYFNSILSTSNALAGVTIDVISLDPDICFIEGTVYHNGQYSATIQDAVTEAIEAYLSRPSIGGVVSIWGLRQAVRAVEGVDDFVIKNFGARANGLGFGALTYYVQNFIDQLITPATTAGHYITETDAGNELSAKLAFSSQ